MRVSHENWQAALRRFEVREETRRESETDRRTCRQTDRARVKGRGVRRYKAWPERGQAAGSPSDLPEIVPVCAG